MYALCAGLVGCRAGAAGRIASIGPTSRVTNVGRLNTHMYISM